MLTIFVFLMETLLIGGKEFENVLMLKLNENKLSNVLINK